jgi:SAM-dependent methyltransferase
MSWSDESSIRQWYGELARAHGADPRGVGWNRRESQHRRFEALCRLGDFDGKRVLDVGCGFGELLAFLRERGASPEYTGVDLCPDMIEGCRNRFGNGASGARFLETDVLGWATDERFDYVVASGIFGLGSARVAERVAPTLEKLVSLARVGVGVNFLSARATRQAPERFYANPAEILELGFACAPAVTLDHSYLPNDFTLRLYVQLPGSGNG